MSFFSTPDQPANETPAPEPAADPAENPTPAPDTPAPDTPDAPPAPPDPQPEPDPARSPAPPEAPAPAPAAPSPPVAPSDPAETPAPVSGSQELEAQLSRMQAQLEQLQEQAASGQLTTQPLDKELADRVKQLREAFSDWPQPGKKFAEAPQPFELQKLKLPQPGVTRDHLPAGEPDTLSPVVISHSQPTIGPGQAGQPVSFLARLLGKLGYPTTISRGQNHSFSFDESVAHAVDAFKRDWHVIEDSSGFRTAEEAAQIVGPWVWEALLRATHAAVG